MAEPKDGGLRIGPTSRDDANVGEPPDDPKTSGEPSAGEPSDGTLVMATLDGDSTAYDELIRRYQRTAVGVAYRLLGNTQDALDVVQSAFLKGFSSLSTLEKPEAFRGWLMRIVNNLSLNYRRSRNTRAGGQLPLDDLLSSDGPAEQMAGRSDDQASSGDPLRVLEGREKGQKLREALEQLPEKQRLALIMFTMEEMPQKEVADALGCTVQAVKWHVFQARKRLLKLLKDVL